MNNKLNAQPDLYIKDEGDFATVTFITDRAKKAVENDSTMSNELYGKSVFKMDIPLDGLRSFKGWTDRHSLSLYSELE